MNIPKTIAPIYVAKDITVNDVVDYIDSLRNDLAYQKGLVASLRKDVEHMAGQLAAARRTSQFWKDSSDAAVKDAQAAEANLAEAQKKAEALEEEVLQNGLEISRLENGDCYRHLNSRYERLETAARYAVLNGCVTYELQETLGALDKEKS